jgi:cell division protein FtsL
VDRRGEDPKTELEQKARKAEVKQLSVMTLSTGEKVFQNGRN